MRTSKFGSSDKNVFVLSITVFLLDTLVSSWYIILPLYLEDLGAGILEVGLCYTFINVAWYGLQFPGALLSDRIGRKSSIVLSTFTFILCYGALSLVSTWLIATLTITVFWIFSGLESPSIKSMIAESVATPRRPKAFATYSFLMNMGLGGWTINGSPSRSSLWLSNAILSWHNHQRSLLYGSAPSSSRTPTKNN